MKKLTKLIAIALTAAFLVAWAVFTTGLVIRNVELEKGKYSNTETLGAADVVALINNERTTQGLHALTENIKLDASAKVKACDMVDKDYFEHLDPSGRTPWHFFLEAGYTYRFAGENLVRGYYGDQESMRRLMASPSHKENIMDKNFTEVGIGKCGNYTVQHFASK